MFVLNLMTLLLPISCKFILKNPELLSVFKMSYVNGL